MCRLLIRPHICLFLADHPEYGCPTANWKSGRDTVTGVDAWSQGPMPSVDGILTLEEDS